MVLYCAAFNCKEKFVKGGSISFHSFPNDKVLSAKWVQAVRRKDFKPTKHSKLCSKHFTESCYQRDAFFFPKLAKDAVPTIFDFPLHVGPSQQKSRKPPMLRAKPCSITDSSSSCIDSYKVASEDSLECCIHQTRSANPPAIQCQLNNSEDNIEVEDIEEKQNCQEEPAKMRTSGRKSYIGDFDSTDMESPKKAKQYFELTRGKIQQHKEKIRALRKTNKRLKAKVENLKSLLKVGHEKNLLSDDATETLKSSELFTLTYGSLVSHILKDYENDEDVNKQLERMGHSIGVRLIEDFLARTNAARCFDLRDTADKIQAAFKMYLGINPVITSWTPAADEFSLLIDGNPLTEFVELPEGHGSLKYCNILAGAIRGALEMVHMEVSTWFVQDQLKGDNITELRVKFIRKLEDAMPVGED